MNCAGPGLLLESEFTPGGEGSHQLRVESH
jgi:hypothetical protein